MNAVGVGSAVVLGAAVRAQGIQKRFPSTAPEDVAPDGARNLCQRTGESLSGAPAAARVRAPDLLRCGFPSCGGLGAIL